MTTFWMWRWVSVLPPTDGPGNDAQGGARLEIITPERFFAPEIGGLNHVAYDLNPFIDRDFDYLLGDWQYEPDQVSWLPNGDLAVLATISDYAGELIAALDRRHRQGRHQLGDLPKGLHLPAELEQLCLEQVMPLFRGDRFDLLVQLLLVC